MSIVLFVKRGLILIVVSLSIPYLRVAATALGSVVVPHWTRKNPERFRLTESLYFAQPESTGGTMSRKHSLLICAGIALVLLFLTNASARADLIWDYNWQPSAKKVFANAGGSGFLILKDEPANSANGSSNTVATNIRAVSTAGGKTPADFNHVPISFTLKLTDAASQKSGTVTFSGSFSGTITKNNANIQLTFTSPMTEMLTLGGNKYTVALGTYTPPGPPGAANAGSLNAFVTVTPGNNGGGGDTPEPASLSLACLAFPFVGLCVWRKRRAKD